MNNFVQLDIVFAGAAAVPIFGGTTVLSRDDLSRKKQEHVTFIFGTLKVVISGKYKNLNKITKI